MVNEVELKKRCLEVGITLTKLAESSDISTRTMSRYLRGEASPTGETIKKFSEILEIADDAEKIKLIFLN